ncbi:MAG: hypothetical protein AB8C02_14460 [Halioglobus sp.]
MKRIRAVAIAGLIFFLASNGALAERQAQHNTPLANGIAELSAIEAALLNTPIAETETDRAEASLYLAKNLVHYLRTDVIQGNPHQPLLLSMPGYGFPNPDNLYLGTQLDPQGVYRVWGRLGNVNRTIFGVYSSKALEGVSGGGARLLGSELKTDAHGHFELFVSLKRMGENWLPMTKDTQSMTIYQIYSDWGFSFYQPWGELLDIASRQASLNSSQVLRESDGEYRLVLSA